MAYDQSVRTLMNNNGYDNSKIGYNQDSGYVTYGGQNFMKPQMNVNGTTYTDQSTFDNAHNQYKGNGANTVTAYNTTQPTTTQPTNQGYTNPYTQQITDIMTRLNAASQAQPVDVYSTPQYAAAQAQAQRGADESIRAGQEMFGNDRMARSSDALQFGQNTQNKANEYLNLQLVPQIQAQLQVQKQQDLQNQQAMFQNLFGLSNQADSRYNSDRTYDAGRQDAATAATGYYTPDANTLSSVRKQMAANSAAYADVSPEQQRQLHEENLKLAASIGGSDTTGNGDYAFGPTRTVQGQQLDYNQQADQRDFNAQEAQRQWDNTFKEGQFDYQKAADLWERNFKDKSFDQSVKQAAQGLGMDYSKMNQSQQQFAAEMAYKYKALEQQENKSNTPETVEDYSKKYLDGLAKYDNEGTLVNGNALESQILSSGKTEAEMRKMYARYGLKWGD